MSSPQNRGRINQIQKFHRALRTAEVPKVTKLVASDKERSKPWKLRGFSKGRRPILFWKLLVLLKHDLVLREWFWRRRPEYFCGRFLWGWWTKSPWWDVFSVFFNVLGRGWQYLEVEFTGQLILSLVGGGWTFKQIYSWFLNSWMVSWRQAKRTNHCGLRGI